MISATAEHAIRAVLLLARLGDSTTLSADAIAEAIGAPRNYLAKTLNVLAKAGVVRSARGAAGGFTLAMPAQVLTIAEVIRPFDDTVRHRACLLRNQVCDPGNPCAVHDRWHAIVGHVEARFHHLTIGALLDQADMKPLVPISGHAPASHAVVSHAVAEPAMA